MITIYILGYENLSIKYNLPAFYLLLKNHKITMFLIIHDNRVTLLLLNPCDNLQLRKAYKFPP